MKVQDCWLAAMAALAFAAPPAAVDKARKKGETRYSGSSNIMGMENE